MAKKKPRPAPFTIVVDNREQHPYRFLGMLPIFGYTSIEIVRTYLPTGDYSLVGLEGEFAIERKSLEDLFGTLGQNRRRFEAEIQRLDAMQFAAIVVEADLRQIWRPVDSRPDWRSGLFPKSVEGTITSWSIRYPHVHWWTVGDRRAGEIRVFGACQKYWKHVCEQTDAQTAVVTRKGA